MKMRHRISFFASSSFSGSYITILQPAQGTAISLGSVVMIAGTTDFADGSTVTIKKAVGGVETTFGTTTAVSGAFSYIWTADGESGAITLKAVCNGIESEVTVTLLSGSPVLSIDSSVLADTPVDYFVHTDVSITSTVTADTPSNI